jgi:hypothetical protein
VDKQVCHPRNFDFYMCAHAGMIVSNLCFLLYFLLSCTNALLVVCMCLRLLCSLRGANWFVDLCLLCVSGNIKANTLPCSAWRDRLHCRRASGICAFALLCVRRRQTGYHNVIPVKNVVKLCAELWCRGLFRYQRSTTAISIGTWHHHPHYLSFDKQ